MPDPRDPRPCNTCGFQLVYDGWDMVHVDGPQRNYGEMNCEFVAAKAAGREQEWLNSMKARTGSTDDT